MFIFQANDKFPMSDINLKKWSEYIEQQCIDDTAVVLPSSIDFIAAINMNGNATMFTPLFDMNELEDGESPEDFENEDIDK